MAITKMSASPIFKSNITADSVKESFEGTKVTEHMLINNLIPGMLLLLFTYHSVNFINLHLNV